MDMTNGNIKKILFRFALPMILSLITQQLYSVVDMIIVGRYLGVRELAAVGNASTVIQILVTLSGGLEMGSEVIFAKYKGENKYKDILNGVKSILFFGLISGLFITTAGMLLKDSILAWIQVPAELYANTGLFINIYISGLAGIFLYDISRAIIVALGDSRCSMILVIVTSLLNVFLDLFFICILQMGIGGAAFATILSQITGMFISLLILRKKLKALKTDNMTGSIQLTKIKEVLSISIPTIVQQLILSLSSLLLQSLVNPYGSQVICGYLAVNKIILFGMLAAIGISQSLSIFTAGNSGAGQINRIKEGYRICIKFTTIYLTGIAVLNFIIPNYLIGAFLDIPKNPEAYQFAKVYLQFSFLAYLFYGWKIINESMFRGFLMMKEYLYSNLSDLAVKVSMTYLLVIPFSTHGFWIGNLLGKLVSFLISAVIIQRKHLIEKQNLIH